MSVVPRSLCAVDGSLYIPADKATMIHAIEGAKAQTVPSVTQNDATQSQPPKVLTSDAMPVLQSMKTTSTMQKLSDMQEAFIQRSAFTMIGYSEGQAVFDRYHDQSLKSKTRQKELSHPQNLKSIHTMSLKELLSLSKTKSSLTAMFAEASLQHFSSTNN